MLLKVQRIKTKKIYIYIQSLGQPLSCSYYITCTICHTLLSDQQLHNKGFSLFSENSRRGLNLLFIFAFKQKNAFFSVSFFITELFLIDPTVSHLFLTVLIYNSME